MNSTSKDRHRQIGFRIPHKMHEALVRAAEDQGVTLAAYLKMLAARELAAHRPSA